MRVYSLRLRCLFFGHSYGEASDVGEACGVVCYACGKRLHTCPGRHTTPPRPARSDHPAQQSAPTTADTVASYAPLYAIPVGALMIAVPPRLPIQLDPLFLLATGMTGLLLIVFGFLALWLWFSS